MRKRLFYLALFAAMLFQSCDDAAPTAQPQSETKAFIRAADISFLPELEGRGTMLYNGTEAQDMITTLKNAGCNTVRIRLWKNPSGGHSGLAEVKALSERARGAGMKIWLSVHYSDTWADPAAQTVPAAWQNLSFDGLKTAVADYTSEVLTQINPDIFQIGNEINSGFLWPQGNLTTQEAQFLELLASASTTIRNQSPETKIMIHFAGLDNAEWFFRKVKKTDYDYIGLSYYPVWHGKDLSVLYNIISSLGQVRHKKVILAEVAYPFTLDWNDWTNNVVGLEDQLMPGYPATPEGQRAFMLRIKNLVQQNEYGLGFSYWGGEWVSFMGNQAGNGSTWENQALYDFDNKALPVMDIFKAE